MNRIENHNTQPTVSVCMITYNHERYIKQAIESILMQETTFLVELVIGEDHSNDNTRQICEKYASEFPHIIRLLHSDINLGMERNFLRTLESCRGKYIALCEGDDYWTYSQKLQRQVEFLEKKSEYNLICHRYGIIMGNDAQDFTEDNLNNFFNQNSVFFDIDLKLLTTHWVTKTLTSVFRREAIDLKELSKYRYFRDVHLFYSLIKKGKGRCFNNNWGMYRKHEGGIHSTNSSYKMTETRVKIYKEIFQQNPSPEAKILYEKASLSLLIKRLFYKKISYSQFLLEFFQNIHVIIQHPFFFSARLFKRL